MIKQVLNYSQNFNLLDFYVNATTSFAAVTMSANPTTVSVSSTLTVIAVLTSTSSSPAYYQTGYIIVNVPPYGSFSKTGAQSGACSVPSSTPVTITTCTYSAQQVKVEFTISTSVTTLTSIVLYVQYFTNPFSSTAITTASVSYYDTANNMIQTYSGATLSGFKPTTMSTASITPDNFVVGHSGAIATVTFKTVGILPKDGKIVLVFPSWTSTLAMIVISNPNCVGTSPLNTGLTCTFSGNTLTVSGLMSSDQSAGTTITFSVDNVRNPYNGYPKTGFTLSTADSFGGYIDQNTGMSYTSSTFTSFKSASMNRADGTNTVGEASWLMPYFILDLPIDQKCRLRIDFPSDMPITNDLSSVSGSGLFSSPSFNTGSPSIASNYVEVEGCSSTNDYTSSGWVGIIILQSIINKAYAANTATFQFTLYAIVGSNKYNIAQQTSSIILNDFLPGTISTFTLTPGSTVVQASTTYAITMKPSHALITASRITIAFPTTITLKSPCSLGLQNGQLTTSSCTVSTTTNTITIDNPWSSGTYSPSVGAFTFTIASGGTNPDSVQSLGTFVINTYDYVGTTYYQVDSDTSNYVNLFTVTASQMTVSVSSSSLVACDSSSYTLSVTPNKKIPISGQLKIVFPVEITGSISSCSTLINSFSQPVTCLSTVTSGILTVQINNAFSSSGYSNTGTAFFITFNGLTNPVSMSSTNSFQVYTMDNSGNQIEYDIDQAIVTMTSLSPLTTFSPSLGSSRNGDSTTLIISVTVNCPLATNSVLYFTAPSEITMPGTPSCVKISNLQSVSCVSGTTTSQILATLKVTSTLIKGSTFSFSVGTIKNPQSTKATSLFSGVSIYDSTGVQVNTYTGVYPSVTTTLPGIPLVASLVQETTAYNAYGQYTIVYTSINQLPATSCFKITYPFQIAADASLTLCQVYIGTTYPYTGCSSDTSNRIVYVCGSPMTATAAGGSQVQITFSKVKNPSTQDLTITSLAMTAYTDSTYNYLVDQISTGLTVGYTCNYPCYTCLTTNKNTCTSCDSTDTNLNYYLQSGTCQTSCNAKYYADVSKVCQNCLSTCATCTTASTCATCATPNPILYNSLCIASCPTGTFLSGSTCSTCDTSCLTCTTSSTNCVSCPTTGTPYFYNNKCLSACDTNFISIGNVCQQCTNNCLTCSGSVSTCLTCNPGTYLYKSNCIAACPTGTVLSGTTCLDCLASHCSACDISTQLTCTTCSGSYKLYAGTCVSSCPTGTYLSGTDCLTCDTTCKTCSTTSDFCLTCDTTATGATPNFLDNSCYTTCPDGYVALSNQCKTCTNNCLTCSGSRSKCTSCDTGFYLYNSQCLASCPTGTVISGSTCVICGGSNCASCSLSDVNTCLQCKTGFFLYNGGCVNSCAAKTFSQTISTIATCQDCDTTCATCSTSSTNCLTCSTTGTFKYLQDTNCVTACSDGYVQVNNVCKTCSLTCLTCAVSISQCTSCPSGQYLYSGTCVSTCPTGYYISGSSCLQCGGDNCLQCSTSNNEVCLKCASSYFLYNSKCVSTCPDKTYQPTGTTTCVACDTTCGTCSTAANNCLTCDTTGKYPSFYSNSCLATCPTGYMSLNNQCKKCTSPCLECSISQTHCDSCISSYYLYQNNCTTTCPIGTIIKDSKCLQCSTNCANCQSSNQTKCLGCDGGYYLYSDSCYKVCPNGYIVDKATQTICIPPSSSSSSKTTTSSSSPTQSSSSKQSSSSIQQNDTEQPVEAATNSSESPYLYFPVTTTQAILGGVAAGSYFKDPTSMIFSNSLALWGPLEFIAYGGQAYLAYVQEVSKETQKKFVTGQQDSNDLNITNSTTKRYLNDQRRDLKLTTGSDSGWPLVFYGTAGSFGMMIFTNIVWGIVHAVLMRKDEYFSEHKKRHRCSTNCVMMCSVFCNFKVGRLHHSRFYGLQKFSTQYDQHQRVHQILNLLTIVNLVLTLLPILFVDIYGIVMNKWGNQFYIIIIETLFLTLCTILITVFEFKHSRLPEPKQDYSKINDMSAINEDELRNRIDSEIRKRFGGESIEEYLRQLKEKQGVQPANQTLKGRGRSNSMQDLNRVLEEDERRVHTDPLDEETKKLYQSKPNPFLKSSDPDYFNNCYAEVGKLPKKKVQSRVKVIQTGERVMDGDEFDREFEQKLKDMQGKNDTRKDDRLYGGAATLGEGEEDPQSKRKNNRSKMRGRKDKYYEQVDNEDMAFAEDSQGLKKRGEGEEGPEDDEEDDDLLDKIDEQDEVDDENVEEELRKKKEEEEKMREEERIKKEQQRLEEERLEALEKERQLQDKLKQEEEARKEKERLEQEEEKARKEEEERRLQEEQLLKDQEEKERLLAAAAKEEDKDLMNFEEEKVYGEGSAVQEQPVNEEQLEQKIIDEAAKHSDTEEKGEYDSDDDNETRLRNMTNPDMRKFNVNDILGDFDRDDKGNLVMLQNQKGGLIDKLGNNVNEKGYLIDEKTGDVVEKENRKKVFDKKDLDDRGEVPPPFNIERYNFNPHDVRGYFDRDAQTGDEIIGNRKNDKGQIIDKLGRLVNEHGYLVDPVGNIIDKRGRLRLHHKQLDHDGNLPLLLNYKGKKFDLKDVIGEFDKDRTGNIIIRRDKDNQMVDKKGRKVNNKGYLIDKEGNVINLDGKVVFEQSSLSKDNEIPKFFPFLKFNIEDIKGDYEMDPLGNPMLQKNQKGDLLDNKGRKVNGKGYLVDESGNIKNKRGYKVFGRCLMEDDGEIPKVFRTGLFRKDTVDSFSQLMNEIEDLEKLHELGEGGYKVPPPNKSQNDETDRINKIIKQIDEEDNDDDIMKEIEELGKMRKDDDRSEGGNTSVDIRMEDTPSNYNTENQRYIEQEDMKNRIKNQIAKQRRQPNEDDEDAESEYMDMPGKIKKKKRKQKKKKKVPKEPTIDERDLLMARAYGGLSQGQVDKLIQDRRRKEMAGMGSQLNQVPPTVTNKPPLQRNASNSRVGSMQSKRFGGGNGNKTALMMDDAKSEWANTNNDNIGGNMSGLAINTTPNGRLGYTDNNVHSVSNRNALREAGKSQAKRTGGGYKMDIKQNNLMGTTQNSFGGQGENASSQKSILPRQFGKGNDEGPLDNPRDRRLSNIANSVSGFYREPTISEHSKLRSTHESNFAQNIGNQFQNNQNTQFKKNNNMNTSQDEQRLIQNKMGGPDGFDPELEKIYGAAKGFGDVSMLSDWEKVSNQSGESRYSQMTGIVGPGGNTNHKKIKGLESIYLQRLEGAQKGRATQQAKKMKKLKDDKQFRVMNTNDGGDLYMDDPRDELDSVLSDNYKQMERQFKQEFVKVGQGSNNNKKQGQMDDGQRPNIFHGNFYQYKEKKAREKAQGILDFEKQQ